MTNYYKELNSIAKDLLIYTFILFLLVLTSANLTKYFQPKNTPILGEATQNKSEGFWTDFLSKNPNYIPGWIELGRNDKVIEIDPNYPITP